VTDSVIFVVLPVPFATNDFGTVLVGSTNVSSILYWYGGIANGTNLIMQSETIVGPDAADFSISTNYTGVTLTYGQNFPFSITFTPSHTGVETANISFAEIPSPPFGTGLILLTGTVVTNYPESYTFITLAGLAGNANYGTNDGTGSAARFNGPEGVAVDANGNVYVADTGNDTIRRITPTGVVTTLAGSPLNNGTNDGIGSAASFASPGGVAVDSAGNVYVADPVSDTIRKVTAAGVVTTLAGQAGVTGTNDGTGSAARFDFPQGVAVDGSGNLYVADLDNDTIRKVTPVGTNWIVTTLAGLAGSSGSADGTNSAARFDEPDGVAVDSTTNLYVSDQLNYTIRKVTPVGTNWAVTTLAGQPGVMGVNDGVGSAAQFYQPSSVAVDSATNLYVADDDDTIRKVALAGTNWVVTTLAGLALNSGTNDGTGSAARFFVPVGVAVDSATNLYVADQFNEAIRKGYPPGSSILSWTNPVLIPYGTALSFNQLDATAIISGSFAYTPTNGTVLNAGTNTLSVVFTPTDTVDFSSSTDTVSLVVSPATLTVTASNASRQYGAANPVFTGAIMGVTNGDNITATYSSIAATNSPPNTYSIVPSLVDPNDRQTNYNASLINGTLTVTQTTPIIAWTNPVPIIYGTALNSNQLNATPSTPGNFNYTPTTNAVLNAGTNTLSVVFTPTDTVDYSSVTDVVSLVVSRAPLTVTAANASRQYGAANPVFTGTIMGITNGDNITATYSSVAATNSPPNTYAIVPSLVDPANRQTNYIVNLVNGTLTVTQAIPIITWTNPAPITYGTALGPNQLKATANTPGNFTYVPTTNAVLNAGTNTLSVVFTPTATADYSIITNTVSLVVSRVPLTVTAASASRPYGAANPVFIGTITGVTNGDSITATYSSIAATNSPPNTYSIVPSLMDAKNRQTNYTVSLVNGTLTVTRATPIITWINPDPIIYGTDLTSNQLDATANVPGNFAYTPTTNAVLNAGTNTLSVIFTPTNTVDYTNPTGNVTVVVLPATSLLTWTTPAPVSYGTPLSSNQLDATANVPGTFAYSPINRTVLNAGTNTLSVVFTPANSVDYHSTTDTVSQMVSQVPLTVIAASASRQYGVANHAFTGTITGLTNGDNITATYSSALTTNSAVGTYSNSIVPSLVDPNNRRTNYAVILVNGTLTVADYPEPYTFITLAGLAGGSGSVDGTNSAAQFDEPTGVAVDGAGNLYVADAGGSTIRKMTPLGKNWVVTTLAGLAGSSGSADGTNSTARFFHPFSLIMDTATNLYVADTYNSTIRKVTLAGTNWVVNTLAGQSANFGAADGTGTMAQFRYPFGVAVDGGGNLYVADTYNQTIREVTPVGTNWVVTTLVGLADNSGSMDGTNSTARFYYPGGVAVDGATNLYVADTYNSTIRKVTPVGANWIVTTLAGQPGDPGSADGMGSAAQFNNLFGLGLDTASNVFVADYGNSTIRKVTPTGVVTTLAGQPGVSGTNDGTGSAAQFAEPAGVTVDSAGNLYVADTDNDTIRKGSLKPVIVIPPQSLTVGYGASATFTITANGAPPLTYQWLFNTTNLTDNAHITGSQSNVLTLTSVTLSNAGAYQVIVSNVYGSTSAYVTLTVTPAIPIIWWPNPAPIIYGTALSSDQLDAMANVPGSFAYNPTTGEVLNAGANVLSVVFTPSNTIAYPGNANYTNAATNVTIMVSTAPLTVTAANATAVVGEPFPLFTGTITGLINGDNIMATYSPTTMTNGSVGTYAIIPALVDPNDRQTNYTVTLIDGSLTVGGVVITAPTNGAFGAYFTTNQSFTVNANASLPAGVHKLALYTNSGSAPVATNNSVTNISIVLHDLMTGGYRLTAVATDSNGLPFTSAVVYITVSVPGTALLDFDPLAAYGLVVSNAILSNYLGQGQFGVSVTNNDPGTTVVAENTNDVAGGGFVSVASPPNVLTQIGSNGPVSFTMGFSNLLTNFSFTRPEVLASAFAPVTHPGWQAQAFDSLGILLAETNEPQIFIPSGSTTNVPAQTYTLKGDGIGSVEFSSEDTSGYTTVNALLLDDFVLLPTTGTLPPAVVVVNPTNGELFATSTPISISAATAAGSGTVAGVAFYYDGTEQVGSAQSSPFSVMGPVPANGIHLLTAVVTNSFGLISTSAPVSITVATGFAFAISPVGQTIGVGRSWEFSATTTSNNVSYQWQLNGTEIPGATNSSYTVSNAAAAATGSYTLVATSGSQSITSSPPAVLTVLGPPTLGSISAMSNGGNIILSVTANDAVNFHSQWLLNGTGIPGANADYPAGMATISYTFISNAINSGNYAVVVYNNVAASNSPPFPENLGPTNVVTTNDTLAGSLAFNPLVGAVAGNNSNSPVSDGNISTIDGKPAGRFLWYNWTTPTHTFGTISLTTRGSSFDTLLGIYTNRGGTLVSVAEDDDSGGYFTSKTPFNFQSNTTYQIAVAGYKSATGNVLLETNAYSMGAPEPVITGQPSNQIVYVGVPVTLSVTADGATGYQWYFENTNVLVGSNATTVISNFLAADVGNYFVQVSNAAGAVQSAIVEIEIQNPDETVGTPTNLAVDKFGDAVDLTGAKAADRRPPRDGGGETAGFTISQSFSTVGATKEAGEPNHAGQAGGASDWYSYTATGPGTLVFDTMGSTFDTILAVYIGFGNSFSTLTNVGIPTGGDFTTNYMLDGQPVIVVSNVVGGTTFYIAIDGYQGESGDANLNVYFQPANLTLGSGAISVTNSQSIVAITSPANDALTTDPSIMVTGTLRGSGGVPVVFSSVQVTVNTNAPASATVAAANSSPVLTQGPGGVEEEVSQKTITWSLSLTLTNGANVITAQSVYPETTNLAIVSLPATRSVFYAPTPPSSLVKSTLTLLTAPSESGRITGQPDNASLEINRVYKVTAVPAGYWIFSNWIGGTNATNLAPLSPNDATLAFLMSSNLILQANFVSNPFTAFVGNYNGLFYQTNTNGVTEASAGFFTATIPPSSHGAYSARLLLDGASYPFSGTFGLTSNTETTVTLSAKTPIIVDLHLTNADQEDQITGSVNYYASTNGWNSPLRAKLAFNAKSNPTTNYAGRYTLVIPPGSNGPGGYGYVTLTNNPAGHVAISGHLGDGTPISQSVPVSANGNIPLYASLYSRQGSLFGWLTLTNNPNNNPPQTLLGTNLTWMKFSSATGTLYAGGFTNTNITVLGSFYTPGVGIPVLTSGTLTFSNGNLASSLTYSNITIVDNKLVSSDLNLSGSVTPGTGVLTLRFRGPGASTETVAQGVLLQTNAQTNAAGWFLSPTQSGYFLLQQ